MICLSPDDGRSVCISDSRSDLTKLSEVPNVEVDLSSVDEHIECFNKDENYNGIVAESIPNYENDDEESNNDCVRDKIGPIDLKDAILSIARYLALASLAYLPM